MVRQRDTLKGCPRTMCAYSAVMGKEGEGDGEGEGEGEVVGTVEVEAAEVQILSEWNLSRRICLAFSDEGRFSCDRNSVGLGEGSWD